MRLSDLAASQPAYHAQGEAEITGITHSTKHVGPGVLFVAIPGLRVDGHSFIPEAIERGAAAVAISRDVPLPSDFPWMRVDNSREALALLSDVFYGSPSKQLRMIGITGTNGKTTLAFLAQAILQQAGNKAGLMGTVQIVIGDQILPVVHTTPEAPEVQAALRSMVSHGLSHAVMEVSSHSLRLQRVYGVEYDTAVFTNLTQDHLDFHGSMEDYFQAKALLFSTLSEGAVKTGKHAIINEDDVWGKRLTAMCGEGVRVLTYGLSPHADINATGIKSGITGSTFILNSPWGKADIRIATPGIHSVYNALAAAGAALAEGCSLDDVAQGLLLSGVPGRMEPVNLGQSFGVYVDYAHTPDGLKNVLQAAKGFAEGRVIVVFGCGGDRDKAKRPIMGSIAANIADMAILTSDNPRSEDPLSIINDVLPGFESQGSGHEVSVEPDRREAIRRAIKVAERGDVIIIAGKGHENYQIFRDKTISFDDRAEAEQALKEMLS